MCPAAPARPSEKHKPDKKVKRCKVKKAALWGYDSWNIRHMKGIEHFG
jgi:hypothetical protein